MSIGMDAHREPPAYLMEKVLGQVNAIANEKPQDGPFALPVRKFPASISLPSRRVSRRNYLR